MKITVLILFVLWVLWALIIGNSAKKKARSFTAFFLLAFVFSPIIILLILLIIPDNYKKQRSQISIDLFNEGVEFYYEGDYQKAIEKLTKSINKHYLFSDAHKFRGMAYQKNGKYKQSYKNYQRALKYSQNEIETNEIEQLIESIPEESQGIMV